MADDADKSAAAPADSPGGRRRFGWDRVPEMLRDRASQRRLMRLSAFLGVTSAVIGTALAVRQLMIRGQMTEGPTVDLSAALAALDAGHVDQARELASELRVAGALTEEERGGPAYVLGAAMVHDAEQRRALHPNESRALYLLAAGYLQEAAEHGFPPGREGHGQYLLGVARYSTGDYTAGIAPLTLALELYPEGKSEIHRLLAHAYLLESTPRLDQALAHLEKYLEDEALTGAARERSLLTAAEIQFRLRDFSACDVTLSRIPADSRHAADALLMRGRIRMQEGDDLAVNDTPEARQAARSRRLAARDAFLRGKELDPADGELVRKAQYLLGLSALRLGEFEEAERQFSHTRRSNYDTPEGLAAGFEEAEVKRLLGKHDEAIHGYGRVLRQAIDMPVYSNPWISLDQLRARSEDAFKDYFAAENFPHAIQMANALTPLTSPEQSLDMQASAYRAKALATRNLAAGKSFAEAAALRADSQSAWRMAAALYEQLAKLRFSTRQYADTVWLGAECYLNGQDYGRAVRLLRIYLANQDRGQHPPALAALGEAELALGEPARALEPLAECIEFFPRDPHSYRARLLAAEANLELGNLARAKELLVENLENEGLIPSSAEWRESLYGLGKIFYREGMQHETASRLQGVDFPDPKDRKAGLKELELAHDAFQQAIPRLAEAIQRDAALERDRFAGQTLEARYLVAESHRHAAKFPLKKLADITIETTRNQLNARIQQELSAAASGYRDLQTLLNDKQSVAELTPQEERILRNAYFALADALYDLEKYEDAIQAYATATNRYQSEPESLEAYVQIANCHRQLNRHSEARGTLEQAKVVLNRIREDAEFTRTTRYDRDEWRQLLDWLNTL